METLNYENILADNFVFNKQLKIKENILCETFSLITFKKLSFGISGHNFLATGKQIGRLPYG